MKKFLSVLIALVLVMSLGVTAFAAVDTSTWVFTPGEKDVIEFTKDYTVTGADGTVYPAETLTFVSTPDSKNPTDQNLEYDAAAIGDVEGNTVTFKLPAYTKAGVYTYTITETAGDTQGVTYDESKAIAISVLIVYDYENSCLKLEEAGVTLPEGETEKDDTITNEYDLGKLTVKKVVEGKLGRKDKLFDIKVTLTTEDGLKVWSDITVAGGSDAGNEQTVDGNGWTGSKEINVKLANDETVTIKNIPAGVSYTVEEDSKHILSGTMTQEIANSDEGYTVSYANKSGEIKKDTTAAAVVTNEKEYEINTGVVLDYLPYAIGLLAVLAIAVFMIIRKRRYSED